MAGKPIRVGDAVFIPGIGYVEDHVDAVDRDHDQFLELADARREEARFERARDRERGFPNE